MAGRVSDSDSDSLDGELLEWQAQPSPAAPADGAGHFDSGVEAPSAEEAVVADHGAAADLRKTLREAGSKSPLPVQDSASKSPSSPSKKVVGAYKTVENEISDDDGSEEDRQKGRSDEGARASSEAESDHGGHKSAYEEDARASSEAENDQGGHKSADEEVEQAIPASCKRAEVDASQNGATQAKVRKDTSSVAYDTPSKQNRKDNKSMPSFLSILGSRENSPNAWKVAKVEKPAYDAEAAKETGGWKSRTDKPSHRDAAVEERDLGPDEESEVHAAKRGLRIDDLESPDKKGVNHGDMAVEEMSGGEEEEEAGLAKTKDLEGLKLDGLDGSFSEESDQDAAAASNQTTLGRVLAATQAYVKDKAGLPPMADNPSKPSTAEITANFISQLEEEEKENSADTELEAQAGPSSREGGGGPGSLSAPGRPSAKPAYSSANARDPTRGRPSSPHPFPCSRLKRSRPTLHKAMIPY